jgi:hypothetical protein
MNGTQSPTKRIHVFHEQPGKTEAAVFAFPEPAKPNAATIGPSLQPSSDSTNEILLTDAIPDANFSAWGA